MGKIYRLKGLLFMGLKSSSQLPIFASVIITTTVLSLFGINFLVNNISNKAQAKEVKKTAPINNLKALDDRLKDPKINHKLGTDNILENNPALNKKMPPNFAAPMPAVDPKNMQRPPFFPPQQGGGMGNYPPSMPPAERKQIEEEMQRRQQQNYQAPSNTIPAPNYQPPSNPYYPQDYPPPPYYYEEDEDYVEEDYEDYPEYYYPPSGALYDEKDKEYQRAQSDTQKDDRYEYEE